ncbi:MAG: 3-hydroxyacyl-CoA dehydrogenase NAD-binding domain-containing protein [Oligoflexia bacterium]|nr:3-hydroxyacyl-CoA dehydrogenase NAD-binding domain-containing protein [Oligoflexia bacterium]
MPTQIHSTPHFTLFDHSDELNAKIHTLVFDTPNEKVNKLSKKVVEEFPPILDRLEALGKDGKIDALVLVSGKTGNFIAGADIEMFVQLKTAEEAVQLSSSGHQLFARWEDLPFPTIAAVDGACLGGGCELALASSAIVMSNDSAARIGLPEVMLGIVPGTGGCIRLPQKVGLATALELILQSKTLNGDRAVRAGLAEVCLPKQEFQTSALRWVKTNLKALKEGQRLAKEPKLGGSGGLFGGMMEKTPMGRALIFSQAKKGVLSKIKGHYPAPLEAIDVIHDAGVCYGERLRGKARDQAMAREAQAFGKLAVTEVSRNLVRLFFLTEGVKKSKGLPAGKTAEAHKVKTAGVLGAGVMGGGIAQLLADKNIEARMKDLNANALTLGVQAAAGIFKKNLQRKKINRREFQQKLNHIAPVLDFGGFLSTDAVIEAIVENLDVKKKVLAELEGYVRPDCVLASNTSSLSISKMQEALKHPERFVGMHFFNPVHKMPLVEVIRGDKSSDEAVSTIFQFSKQLGKTPIVVKDAPGFLVNRLLMPYCNEAANMLAEGVPIEDLDRVMLAFGMPMGPIELIDEVGIDVGAKVAHILHDAFGERMQPSALNDKLVKEGYLGKKNGKGFYPYDAKQRRQEFDPKIYEVLGVSPKRGAVSDDEIRERCVLIMINEASRCLAEGVVASAAEVDLGMIMGTGFPPFRGGLLRYADTIGAQTIVKQLSEYAKRLGARFAPADPLVVMAQESRGFYKA